MKPVKVKTNKFSPATVEEVLRVSHVYAALAEMKNNLTMLDGAVRYLHKCFRKSYALGLFFMSHFERGGKHEEWHKIVCERLKELGSLQIHMLTPEQQAKAVITHLYTPMYPLYVLTIRKIAAEYEKFLIQPIMDEADALHQTVEPKTQENSRRSVL